MKQAILFASFGVVNAAARTACIDAAASQIAKAFPAYEVRQAYTSVTCTHLIHLLGIPCLL